MKKQIIKKEVKKTSKVKSVYVKAVNATLGFPDLYIKLEDVKTFIKAENKSGLIVAPKGFLKLLKDYAKKYVSKRYRII